MFRKIVDRYGRRPAVWKVTYFLMNTDYLIGLLKLGKREEAIPTIHAYEYIVKLLIESDVLDDNEKKILNNLYRGLRGHLENLYLSRSIEYNLKISLDYLQDMFDRVKDKLDIKQELGFVREEDPEEVINYFHAIKNMLFLNGLIGG